MGTEESSKAMDVLARESMNKSSILYTETGLPAGVMPKIRQEVIDKSRNYRQYLYRNASLNRKWEKYLENVYGFSGDDIARIRVSDFIETILAQFTMPQIGGEVVNSLRGEFGAESILTEAARKQGVEPSAIEDTPEIYFDRLTDKQVENYSNIAYQKMAAANRLGSDFAAKNVVVSGEALITMHKTGDVDGIANMLRSAEMYSVKKPSAMLINNYTAIRNADIARNIDTVLKKNEKNSRVVVAVGVAHLGGDYGVLSLMKNSGYSFSCYFK
jgi:hypothetical protein